MFTELCNSESECSDNETCDDDDENLDANDGSKPGTKSRRRRTAFTSEQLLELEREFHAKKYLSLTERSQIATSLKLSEVQVGVFMKFNSIAIWLNFFNHKKDKNMVSKSSCEVETSEGWIDITQHGKSWITIIRE